MVELNRTTFARRFLKTRSQTISSDNLMVDNNRWLQFSRFCEVTLLTIIVKELYTHIKTHMAPPLAGGEKELSR